MDSISLRVSEIRVVPAREEEVRSGLIAYLSFLVGGKLRIDGVTLRRTRGGRLILSFPAKRNGGGVERPFVRPIDSATREAIEQQVFAELGLSPEEAR